jgi:hypothetical protein
MPIPPAFETAATSFGKLTKAIPASMMGCFIPKSSVILVFIVISPYLITLKIRVLLNGNGNDARIVTKNLVYRRLILCT